MGQDSKVSVTSYIQLIRGDLSRFLVGYDANSEPSTIRALVSVVNRLNIAQEETRMQRATALS